MASRSKTEWEAANLRYRVSVLDFAGAEASSRAYAALVAGGAGELPREQAEALLRGACDLLQWARQSLSEARDGLAAELGRLGRISLYQPHNPAAATLTWRIDA